MSRPSKLTVTDCSKVRTLRDRDVPVTDLAKKFHVSTSSIYKVLDGSYVARPTDKPAAAPKKLTSSMRMDRPITPNVFDGSSEIVEVAMPDEVTLRAAELIVARSRFAEALRSH
jgi:hypothetical protein